VKRETRQIAIGESPDRAVDLAGFKLLKGKAKRFSASGILLVAPLLPLPNYPAVPPLRRNGLNIALTGWDEIISNSDGLSVLRVHASLILE
jgi:hypothetical protein